MGFFSALFGKKKASLKTDRVYMTRAVANQELSRWVEQNTAGNQKTIIVYYFRETRAELEKLILDKTNVSWVNAHQASFIPGANEAGSVILFAETYPVYELEQKLLESLERSGYTQKVVFFNSLEDPIFIPFGAERIRKLMTMMGMKEDEAIEHRTITSSLDRAQKKISAKNMLIQKTDSRTEMIRILTEMKK